jgi:hypothetical protein
MKSIKMVFAVAAVSLTAFGASIAYAQDTASSQPEVQAQESDSVPANRDDTQRQDTQSQYPSGFNTGPTQSHVPGCVGPVSYCNIYFGS